MVSPSRLPETPWGPLRHFWSYMRLSKALWSLLIDAICVGLELPSDLKFQGEVTQISEPVRRWVSLTITGSAHLLSVRTCQKHLLESNFLFYFASFSLFLYLNPFHRHVKYSFSTALEVFSLGPVVRGSVLARKKKWVFQQTEKINIDKKFSRELLFQVNFFNQSLFVIRRKCVLARAAKSDLARKDANAKADYDIYVCPVLFSVSSLCLSRLSEAGTLRRKTHCEIGQRTRSFDLRNWPENLDQSPFQRLSLTLQRGNAA